MKRGIDINAVKPIKNQYEILNLLGSAKAFHPKYYILLILGLLTGLRISDLLRIKVKQVRSNPFVITEKKTKKKRTIELSTECVKEIEDYILSQGLRDNHYLIYSRRTNKGKALSRVQAYNVIRRLSGDLGLRDIGTHSMRKTFARDLFKATHDIEKVQEVLNHKYVSTTIRYLFDLETLNNMDI